MTTQAQLLAHLDGYAMAILEPAGAVDIGDWCGRGGASRTGVHVIVDHDTQEIGADGVSLAAAATQVELYEHELGQAPNIGDTVRVGSTVYQLKRLVLRNGNAHRFEVSS